MTESKPLCDQCKNPNLKGICSCGRDPVWQRGKDAEIGRLYRERVRLEKERESLLCDSFSQGDWDAGAAIINAFNGRTPITQGQVDAWNRDIAAMQKRVELDARIKAIDAEIEALANAD